MALVILPISVDLNDEHTPSCRKGIPLADDPASRSARSHHGCKTQMIYQEPINPRPRVMGRCLSLQLSECDTDYLRIGRRRINDLFAMVEQDLSDEHRNDLVKRLQSRRDNELRQAIDELRVYEKLALRWGDIRHEESGGDPDWRIYENNKLVGAVEVFSIFDPPTQQVDLDQHARLGEAISLVSAPGITLTFTDVKVSGQVKARELATWIQEIVDKVGAADPGTVHPAVTLPEAVGGKHVAFDLQVHRPDLSAMSSGDGGQMHLQFDETTMLTASMIQIEPDEPRQLVNRLQSKTKKRYREQNVPFYVAVGVHTLGLSFRDIESVLLGTTLNGKRPERCWFTPTQNRRFNGVAFMAPEFWEDGYEFVTATILNPFSTHDEMDFFESEYICLPKSTQPTEPLWSPEPPTEYVWNLGWKPHEGSDH